MENHHSEEPVWHSTHSDFDLSKEKLVHLKTKKDVRLGDVDEFQPEDETFKEHLLRKEITVEDESQLSPDGLKNLKTRIHLKHENLLSIYGFKLETASNKLSLFFESFVSDAEVVFYDRQKNGTFFDEEELQSTLSAVAQGLAYLQKHKISHGHITPDSILMSKEGDIKLLDHSLFAKEYSAFYACLNGTQVPYLAPELFNLLTQEKPELSNINAYKADVFSLGMVLLYAALLEEPTDCYNWENYTFDSSKLANRLDRVQRRYPGSFSNLLSHLLKVNEFDRQDAQTILSNLPYYEKHGDFNKFTSFYTPEKLQMSGNALSSISGHLKRSDFLASTQGHSTSQYSFVDPRVQEIIREAKEKNWIKATLSAGHSKTDNLSYERQYRTENGEHDHYALLSQTGLKYSNPFLEGSRHQLSKSGFIYSVVTQENNEEKYEQSKFQYNTPQVNEIIASIKNAQSRVSVIERKPDFQGLYANHLESSLKKSFSAEERNIDSSSGKAGASFLYTQIIESPEKKSANFNESSFMRHLSAGTLSPSSTLTTLQYHKKYQTKSEVVKELREKYGSKTQQQEEKVAANDVQASEVQASTIETKKEQEIEA